MKTKVRLFSLFVMMLFIGLQGCQKPLLLNGSAGDLILKATTGSYKSGSQTMNLDFSVPGGSIRFSEVYLNMVNITIEENSGKNLNDENGKDVKDNDSIEKENKKGNQTDSDKSEGKEGKEGKEKDLGDVVLPGPYLVEIHNGTIDFDKVSLPAGTYKQAGFDLKQATGLSGYSVQLTGTFTSDAGAADSVIISSDLEATFQYLLPLGGLVLQANGQATISIVFSIDQWMANIYLSQATLTDGKILIDPNHNIGLYKTFVSNLSKNIDLEDN